jgi:predicted transposase/invertase (TIGR01784 family)
MMRKSAIPGGLLLSFFGDMACANIATKGDFLARITVKINSKSILSTVHANRCAKMSQPLLDPRNDFVFKLLFASSLPLLSDLINAVRIGEPPITVISVLNPHIAAAELKGKYIELDILAKDHDGNLFNVEMQMSRRERWSARSMVYLSKTLGTQLKAGVDYAKLKPVIGIHLLVYDLFPEQEQACWCFEMRDRANPAVSLGSELQLYVVELSKADQLARRGNQSGRPAVDLSALSAWVKYFQHWKEPRIMNQIAHPPVRQAMRKLKVLSADDETRRLAEVRERALMIQRTEINAAEKRGEARGEARGKALGKQEGVNEANAKAISVLIQRGMSEAEARTLLGLAQLPST